MLEKIEMDADRPLLVSNLKKKFNFSKIYQKFFYFTVKKKVVHLRPYSIFFAISEILKTTFYVFWTQTCRDLKSINFLIS